MAQTPIQPRKIHVNDEKFSSPIRNRTIAMVMQAGTPQSASVGGCCEYDSPISLSGTLSSTPNKRNVSNKKRLVISCPGSQEVIVKGPWTKEEDDLVAKLVEEYGAKKWSLIATKLIGRCGKQCRERWHNHLSPQVNKRPWTAQEEEIILRKHSELGNKWAEISKFLPGRTDNSVKNHWNSAIRRRLKKQGIVLQSNETLTETAIIRFISMKKTAIGKKQASVGCSNIIAALQSQQSISAQPNIAEPIAEPEKIMARQEEFITASSFMARISQEKTAKVISNIKSESVKGYNHNEHAQPINEGLPVETIPEIPTPRRTFSIATAQPQSTLETVLDPTAEKNLDERESDRDYVACDIDSQTVASEPVLMRGRPPKQRKIKRRRSKSPGRTSKLVLEKQGNLNLDGLNDYVLMTPSKKKKNPIAFMNAMLSSPKLSPKSLDALFRSPVHASSANMGSGSLLNLPNSLPSTPIVNSILRGEGLLLSPDPLGSPLRPMSTKGFGLGAIFLKTPTFKDLGNSFGLRNFNWEDNEFLRTPKSASATQPHLFTSPPSLMSPGFFPSYGPNDIPTDGLFPFTPTSGSLLLSPNFGATKNIFLTPRHEKSSNLSAKSETDMDETDKQPKNFANLLKKQIFGSDSSRVGKKSLFGSYS